MIQRLDRKPRARGGLPLLGKDSAPSSGWRSIEAGASPRIAFVTLGCPKNQVDSEVMLGRLFSAGFATTARLEDADMAVVNTCAFLEAAVAEGIDTILNVAEHKKARLKGLVVAGCMPQRYSGKLLQEIPEIDAIVGTGDVDRIVEVCRQVLAAKGLKPGTEVPGTDTRGQDGLFGKENARPTRGEPLHHAERSFVGDPNRSYLDPSVRVLSTPRHSPYLQVSQGCSNACTFCIIPALRGPGRSRPLDGVVAEARRLVEAGAKEIVLIGQDTTAYGLDTEGRPLLGDLLARLDDLASEGLKWVRLMYTNPLFWDEALIDRFAASKTACPYIDVPIQHVADQVLHRMGRGYTGRHCRWLLRRLRQAAPQVALRTSVIVGFPGETEAHSSQMIDFLEETRFDRLVAFPYFPEEGTAASRLPGRVTEGLQQERLKKLLGLQSRISREKNRYFVGQTLDVLVDKPGQGNAPAEGRSYREAPEVDGVIRLTRGTFLAGEFVRVVITSADSFDLEGVSSCDETSLKPRPANAERFRLV